MKILYVVHAYWPKYQAGTENYTHYLAESMAKLGHEVFVIAPEPQSEDRYYQVEEEQEGKVKVFKIRKNVTFMSCLQDSYLDRRYEEQFTKLFDEIKPDLVHVQHLLHTSLPILAYMKKQGVPIIYTLHDAWFECLRVVKLDWRGQLCYDSNPNKCLECLNRLGIFSRRRDLYHLARNSWRLNKEGNPAATWELLKKTFLPRSDQKNDLAAVLARNKEMKKLLNNIDLFISPSRFLYDVMVKWGIPKNKIIHSRNGIKLPERLPEKASKPHEKKAVTFGFTSFVRPEKGINVLLEAFQILAEKNIDNARLLIYGRYDQDSLYGKNFMKLAKKLDKVTYKGSFDNKDIGKILSGIDYLVLPALWFENAPIVIEEAYLSKIPCVVSNVGGMAERVEDKVNGLHFRVGDSVDLAKKLQYLIEHPEIRAQFVKNIPAVKSIAENAAELENIYQKYITLNRPQA